MGSIWLNKVKFLLFVSMAWNVVDRMVSIWESRMINGD